MLLSVCIVVPPDAPPLDTLLVALREQSAGPAALEVVLVGSPKYSVESAGGLPIIKVTGAGSPGTLRNLAWRAASGAGIAYIAADLVPAPLWAEALLQALRRGRRLVRGSWLPIAEDVRAGKALEPALLWSGRTLGVATSEQLACLRADLEAVGGFREGLFDADVCDTDLAARLVDNGVDPFWARHAVAYFPVAPDRLEDSRARVKAISTVLAEHPRARARLMPGGLFWHRHQAEALLLVGAVVAAVTRRDRRLLLLALPWLHERTCLTPRVGGPRRKWLLLPGVLATDLRETVLTTTERLTR